MAATEQKNVKDVARADLVSLLGLTSAGKMGRVGVQYDVIAPPATGVQATDTANLQAAIDDTPAYGRMFIPRGQYELSAPLVIDKAMSIHGAGSYQYFKSGELPDIPLTAPYLAGTVLSQNTAGADIIQITGSRIPVFLEGFGGLWAPAIRFTDTGHGVHTIPALLSGGPYQDTSIAKCTWRNVNIWGHDGDHYGFRLVNFMHCIFKGLGSNGGGIFGLVANTQTVNYGNSVFINPMGTLTAAGTADAYRQESTSPGTFGLMNFNQFIRPQVNHQKFPGVTEATVAQAMWRDVGGDRIRNNLIISPDFETSGGSVDHPIVFGAETYVQKGGGFLPPYGASYLSEPQYNRGVRPTAVAGAAAGTGGVAEVLTNSARTTDLAGIVKIDVGTSPGTNNNLAVITFAHPLKKVPNFIKVGLNFVSSGTTMPVFYATQITATEFAIRSVTAPQASASYQLWFEVVF